jgi:hypothetical protein
MRGNRALPWVLLAVGLLAIAVLSRGGDDTGEELDPRSTGPLGARGLVLLLEEMGADVAIGPRVDGDVAVLLVDEIGRAQEEEVREFVERGGTLVVADPLSSFAPALTRSGASFFDPGDDDETLAANCAMPAVSEIRAITAPNAVMFRVKPGAIGCFGPSDDGARGYLVARSEGDGSVVALAGGAPFVNDRLDEVDNAVLAVSLMAPQPGVRVTVLEADAAGSGEDSLLDLMPGSVKSSLWQLVVAFAALVLWRARRLARPVEETQPVAIPGSELVIATGNLLHRAGRRDASVQMLQSQLRRDLAMRFGLSADLSVEQVADVLVTRGIPAAKTRYALSPRRVDSDEEFVAVASAIESLRKEVLHV